MPEHGFGRCDGHHKMVDPKLKKQTAIGNAYGDKARQLVILS